MAKRVEEELEKRKDEIEREVLRRVEEAKRIMERQLLEELERQRQAELAAQKAREVTLGRLERSPSLPSTPSRPLTPPVPISLPVTHSDWCLSTGHVGAVEVEGIPSRFTFSERNPAMAQVSLQ